MERLTVLIDDDCGFCRWSAARLRSWDRRGALRFETIQGRTGRELLRALPVDRRLEAMHAVTRAGTVRTGGAALPDILRVLPGGAPIARLAASAPGLTERAYRAVAARRDRLGRMLGQTACAVDPAEGRPR